MNKCFSEMSIADDNQSIMNVLQSACDAAKQMESFLSDGSTSNDDNVFGDDSSITSELRRLHDSEELLRKELEAIGSLDDVECHSILRNNTYDDENDSDYLNPKLTMNASFGMGHDRMPLLLPMSPVSSSNSVDSQDDECLMDFTDDWLDTDARYVPSKGFGPPRHLSFDVVRQFTSELNAIMDSASEQSSLRKCITSQDDDSTSRGVISTMASFLFGRHEYMVTPLLCSEDQSRTIQGTMALAVAIGFVVYNQYRDSCNLDILLSMVPLWITLIVVHLPHKIDESVFAVGIFALFAALRDFCILA